MIGWDEVYKVVVAMVPLYVALGLGYGSVKWWHMFKPDHCDAINRFNCYFVIPFFTFQFTSNVNPYRMNYRFLAGDAIAKSIVGIVLALWANFWRYGNFSWAITSFSLSCFNNTLVVGVPLLKAMYGEIGEDLVVQISVIQFLLWVPILLFLLEFRQTVSISNHIGDSSNNGSDKSASTTNIDDGDQSSNHDQQTFSIEIVTQGAANSSTDHEQLQQEDQNNNAANANKKTEEAERRLSPQVSLGSTVKKVLCKLAQNPNMYACAIGIIWALIAKRWNLQMPSIVDGSIQIMGKAGSGVAMFSMGLFMALQEKVIAGGVRLTVFGMVLRFVCGPLTTAIGSLVFGLRGNTLRIAIIQAALPQAIASFVFAKEYSLHADVLSTAVIFGTLVSLPLLIVYYLALDAIP